jgi:hypothetical protein
VIVELERIADELAQAGFIVGNEDAGHDGKYASRGAL